MDNRYILTKDERIFFMDMIGSFYSPNYVPKLYKVKPYSKILKDRSSDKYKLFIEVFKTVRHILSEREMIILDDIYGVNKESSSLKTAVGKSLNISTERVRQILKFAEFKIAKELSGK